MAILGSPIREIPVRFERVRTICRIAGRQLISLLETAERTKYLEVWVDRDEGAERSLLFRIVERDLTSYLHGKVSLLNVMQSPIDGFVFVRDETPDGYRVSLLSAADVPDDVLPTEDSFYVRKYDPSPDTGDELAVLLKGQWEMEQLAEVDRAYIQVLAAARCLGPSPPAGVENLKNYFDKYQYEGGWVRHNTLAAFVDKLTKRPTTKEVQYSSPGIMRIAVDPKDGSGAREALRRFRERQSTITSLYHSLHDQLLDLRRMEREQKKPSQAETAELKRSIVALVKELGVITPERVDFVAQTGRAAGEIVASYYRRLKKLADFEEQDRATFL